MRFATRLKSAREQAGFSIRGLAEIAGCSHGFLDDLERGDRYPSSLELVYRLAMACGICPEQLANDLEYDRSMHWISKRPKHLSDEQVKRIREIALDEEQEPVAA